MGYFTGYSVFEDELTELYTHRLISLSHAMNSECHLSPPLSHPCFCATVHAYRINVDDTTMEWDALAQWRSMSIDNILMMSELHGLLLD
jgi:hypothetical protein